MGVVEARAAVESAFERPSDPLFMTGADRVGGVYALMRRYLLALVPATASPALAADIASAVMSDLSVFAKSWLHQDSPTLNQKGVLHGKLELVDLIRAMEENKGQR